MVAFLDFKNKKLNTYAVGHINPDTDSIVSAIAVAELFNCIPARAGEINKETEYVLKRFGFRLPKNLPAKKKQVILVDHNEPDQINEDSDHAEIIAIYDHHKLGGLFTPEPITIWHEPVGSTATIITDLFGFRNEKPSKKIAGILLAGIISDTLNLNSPTTTEKDRRQVKNLNRILNIDIDQLATEMFRAKSEISHMKTEELVAKDYKAFKMGGKKVGIAVWETVLPEMVLERSAEIEQILTEKKPQNKLDYLIFVVVDILKEESVIIPTSDTEKEIVLNCFKANTKDDYIRLKGVVSRKKQIAPVIEKYLLNT